MNASQQAEHYLAERGTGLSQADVLLFAYIPRRFSLPQERVPLDDAFVNKPIPEEVSGFLRLVDPEFSISSDALASAGTSIDRLTLRALYCDQLPLESNYLYVLSVAARGGGYEATHAALAFQWLHENRCVKPTEVEQLRTQVKNGLVAVINSRTRLIDDPYVEAVVMMYYAGFGDEVDSGWLNRIVDAQLANGGWPANEGGGEPSDHTTLLAYWAMLEAQHPKLVKKPWLQPSSGQGL